VGIARGGLIPATLVAHRLGLRRVVSLGMMSYDDGVEGQQGTITTYGPVLDDARIIIDDIIDSGRTLAAVRQRFPGAHVGALIDKTGGASGVFAGRQTQAGVWVAFPWEGMADGENA